MMRADAMMKTMSSLKPENALSGGTICTSTAVKSASTATKS
jgi:hypothetical protein